MADAPTTEAIPPTGQVVKPKRGRETALDMLRSMGLLLVVIFVLLFVTPARTLIFPGGSSVKQTTTDTEQLAEWKALTGHPAGLPDVPSGWTINAATMSGTTRATGHLHVGWVSPQNQYLGVDESTLPPAKLIAAALAGLASRPAGDTTINGQTWQVRTDRRNDTVLLRTVGPVTTLVVGTMSPAQVRSLAAST